MKKNTIFYNLLAEKQIKSNNSIISTLLFRNTLANCKNVNKTSLVNITFNSSTEIAEQTSDKASCTFPRRTFPVIFTNTFSICYTFFCNASTSQEKNIQFLLSQQRSFCHRRCSLKKIAQKIKFLFTYSRNPTKMFTTSRSTSSLLSQVSQVPKYQDA